MSDRAVILCFIHTYCVYLQQQNIGSDRTDSSYVHGFWFVFSSANLLAGELDEQVSLVETVAFLDEDALDDTGDRSGHCALHLR